MKKKKNKGSAFAMVLVLLLFMSYISIMIMSASYENIRISRSYMGDRTMYRGTDYVANLISVRLQSAVRDIQDTTRNEVIATLQGESHLKSTYEPSLINVGTNSNPQYTSNPNYMESLTNEGALNSQDYDAAFNKEYKEAFKTNFNASAYGKSVYTAATMKTLINNKSKNSDSDEYYKVNFADGETMYYKFLSAGYDATTECVTCQIETKFEYNNERRSGGNFKNRNVSTIIFKVCSDTDSFNIENYKIVNNRNDEIPIFDKNVALIAQNNIIFSNNSNTQNSNNINITGDVIALGHVPTDSNGLEDEKAISSDWQRYGGILFGYSQKLKNYTYKYLNGTTETSQSMDNRADIFGNAWIKRFTSTFKDTNRLAGNVTIDGNVATMSYVNILNNKDNFVRIKGDTFARQFMLSEDAHQTSVYLGYEDDRINKYQECGNLIVTDDLQVDPSYSKLIIYGDFYGLSNKYSLKGGDNDDSDWKNEKRTSTLNINGNSIVELRNKVYIGGTSFLATLKRNEAGGSSNNTPFMTGISGAKTSQVSAEAYIYSDKNQKVLTKPGATVVQKDPVKVYYKWNNLDVEMMVGYDTKVDEGFTPADRAIHFKEYFEEKVANNFGLLGTGNFANLRVKIDDSGRMLGWAQGVVIASGIKDFDNMLGTERVYAYYNKGNNEGNFSEYESDVFASSENRYGQYAMEQRYQTYMDMFLNNDKFGSNGSNLIQTGVDIDDKLLQKTVATKAGLTAYIDNVNSDSVLNYIKNNPNKVYVNEDLDAIVYYGGRYASGNLPGMYTLSKNTTSGKMQIKCDYYNTTTSPVNSIANAALPYNKGIIFLDGDLVIESNVSFEGIIVTTGNITITGTNVNITRKKDTRNIYQKSNDIVTRLKEEDYSTRMFFGLNEYDIDPNNAVVQRINQDYVKLIKWTLE